MYLYLFDKFKLVKFIYMIGILPIYNLENKFILLCQFSKYTIFKLALITLNVNIIY